MKNKLISLFTLRKPINAEEFSKTTFSMAEIEYYL